MCYHIYCQPTYSCEDFYQRGFLPKRTPPPAEYGAILANPMILRVFRWCCPCTHVPKHLQGGCMMRHPAIALAFALLALPPARAHAQSSPDFLFGSPKGTVGVR